MTHRRKTFLVYPPDYKPGDGFAVRRSKRKAWMVATRLGVGASVDVTICIHPGPRQQWESCCGKRLWVVCGAER